MSWLLWVAIQLVMLSAQAAGSVVLAPFCAAQAWTAADTLSTDRGLWKPKDRKVDHWRLAPLNAVYGNPADGVSGQQAIVWGTGTQAGTLQPYMPGADPRWRAYCWNMRNGADALKYVFRWRGKSRPPYWRGLGWKAEDDPPVYVPVFGNPFKS